MNTQTVTPETARKLAAAGFPQPAPAPGQWWDSNGSLIFIWSDRTEGESKYFTVTHYENGYPFPDMYFDARDFRGLVYLPTVGDILKELPDATLYFSTRSVYYKCSVGVDGMSWSEHRHEHPAEAAAGAYLDIHEKK